MKWKKPLMSDLDMVGPCHCPDPPLLESDCPKLPFNEQPCADPPINYDW